MNKRIWHSGSPPHIGWWNAGHHRYGDIWRWWNGKSWSVAVEELIEAEEAGRLAFVKINGYFIEWSDYWPANARVPRIKP